MGCNQSSPGQVWAHSNDGGLSNENSGKLSHAVLERYLALDGEIAEAEQGLPTMVLQHKRTQIEELDEKISDQKALVETLELETIQEGSLDLEEPDTKKIFLQQGAFEGQEKDMQAYLDGENKKEIANAELSKLIENRVNLHNEIEELEGRSDNLVKLYEEQEHLLNEIFGGSYGSESENRLEAALDQHEQMRNRIVEANFKWRQAQLMIDYAYKQLEHAVKRWLEIPEVDASDLEGRYTIASETRNNLVAAAQNIQGAQRYLANVQFPYCAPPEVDTLNKATAYIFTDMQTPERHDHALECYTVTWKRCGALLQWIHQVVTQTISRDLDDINAKVKAASRSLRKERVKLIKRKVKEVLGRDVDISVADIDTDVRVDLNHNDLALTEGINPNELTLTPSQLAALSALLADEDLAPPPSSQEVFGEKFEQLSREFRADHERIIHQEEEGKSRVAHSLEEKLAARRQRRARRSVEAKQKDAYKSG